MGDVSGDHLLPSSNPNSNFYSNLPPIDINAWQGENILNSEYEVTENLSSFEQESHGDTDILIGSNVVENALPRVQDLLQNFSSKVDFEEQINLAFGDGYDVSKADVLVDSWQDENSGFLPEIKIVSEDEINGAKGAFAGETETIYLAEEFVEDNVGDLEAIASVIVEEYGHYFDWEINSFDSPGDEGEIFASFVLGEELSGDELLRMKQENDEATVLLNGENISIEQANVSWLGGSGDWYNARKWSGGKVPKSTDNVTVETFGQNIKISFSKGNPNIRDLFLGAKDSGSLTLNGLTNVGNDTDILAEGKNSVVKLPDLKTFSGKDVYQPSSITVRDGGKIEANKLATMTQVDLFADNSNLQLPAVNNFTGIDDNAIKATNKGKLTLGAKTISGDVDISVIGKGSVVDLPRLTAFNGKDVYLPSFIEVKNDATLKAQKLATIKQVDLYADNSKLELLGLNNLTGIDDNVVKARNQGKLTLAAKTISGDVDITAIGKDSLVDLSGLKNFNGKDVYLPSFIEAKNNGVIKASRLESLEQVDLYTDNGTIQLSGVKDLSLNGIDDNAIKATNQGKLTLGVKTISGDVDISVIGKGSVVDLPRLTAFNGKDVYLPSFIEVKNDATLKAQKLATIKQVDLYADNSKLELLGLNNLTGIDDNVVKARNQGKLTLAAKTISGDVDITAIGKDSLVDLSGLKNFNGKDVYLPSFIEAKNNGVIKASRLESLEQVDLYADNGTIQLSGVKDLSLNGIDDNAIKATNQGKLTLGAKTLSGDVDITSSGEGSVVNLPKLTRFLGKDVYLPSFIEAKNGGKVKANKLTTVTNVDPLDIDIASEPNITISDTTVTEGNKGRKNAKFTVNLDSESDKTVKVNYATANDTAKAGKDYQKTIGTLTFKPGQTKKTITVPILGDTLDESNKKFNVNLSKPRNAKLGDKGGIGTIRDNDHGTPKLSIGNESIVEGNKGRKNAKFTVTLDSKTDETVKVNYATADGSAKAGKDYRKINGTLTFKPGQTKKTITVPVLGDTIDESDEKFNVDLSKPRNAEFGDKRGIGTIRDNDEKTPNNNDSKSNEKGSVHVIYINGVNTTNKQYKDSLPLIEKLLEETDIKNDYILYENTYNKGGRLVFDLAQSALQAFVPGDFNDFEGINFRENVVKQIKNIDQRETKEGKCEDNPRAKFLIIAHSQGNFFAEEIYNKLPANIKNRTKILAMAPFTNFKGISNNNFDYLLREDDYPNVFKGVWGIAVPNDKSNLPKWPGKPDGLPEGADKEAHDLENYLNPNRYSKGTQKDKLVEESFNMAKNGINNLMKFDSGHYKNNEQGCVEVTASFKPSGNPWAISKLYLVSPERKYIGTAPNSLSGLGNDAGKTVSLGKFAPGTKLKFETKVTMFDDLDHTEQIDKFTLSSTNRREAKLDQWWGGYGTLGFEDSYSGEAFGAQAEKPNDFNDTEVYLNGANFKGNNIIVREAYFWE